jgi:murein DD-endopeptidase MepM/ murein hydrolase activator NlpD
MKKLVVIFFALLLSMFLSGFVEASGEPAIRPVPPDYEAKIRQYDTLTNKWADYYGVPADLIRRMMWFESRGSPNATSPAGAMGLMQIMPYWFYSYENPYDPNTNIMTAAYILNLNHKSAGTWVGAVKMYFGVYGSDVWGTTAQSYVDNIFDYTKTMDTPTTTLAEYVYPLPDNKTTVVNLHWGTFEGASDLFAPFGSKVVAVHGGDVYSAGWNAYGGNSVYIVGDDGLDYYYAHLAYVPKVKVGQHVEANTLLGYVGNTGNAVGTDPHLHLGIGYGIYNGNGATGGAGIDYDAVSLLRRLQ